MHYVFGDEIFKRMIIVITKSFLDLSEFKVNPKKIEHLQRVFLTAFRLPTTSNLTRCPLIVYISLNDDGTTVRKKLRHADTITKSALSFNISMCIKCGAKIQGIRTDLEISRHFCVVINPRDGR